MLSPGRHRGSATGSVIAAIPARYGSQRFPGKPLARLRDKPLIQHVWERARAAGCFDRIVVLTDDDRIRATVQDFGGEVEMTPADLASGTDRIAWAARSWHCQAIVNVQGDEPRVAPQDLARLAGHLALHPEHEMVTLATRALEEELDDPNAVKLVLDCAGRALYFSRAAIPHRRNPAACEVWKHVGVYGYRREVLLRLAALQRTPLETCESLEQLRALENGIAIWVLTGAHPSIGVDTPEDLVRLEHSLEGVESGEAS